MIRPALIREHIFQLLLRILLDDLLKRGFIILEGQAVLHRILDKTQHKGARAFDPAVEVNGCDHRLKCVR